MGQLENLKKYRQYIMILMIVLAAGVTLFGIIDFITVRVAEDSLQPLYVCSTLSVIFGICNFVLALGLVVITYLAKADLKSALIIGVPAIGEFVLALIMTNFTNETKFQMHLLSNINYNKITSISSLSEAIGEVVYPPIILSVIFAVAVISATIRAIKNGSVGTYTPAAYNGQQMMPNQMPGQQMPNMQVPTPQNDQNNNNNNNMQ